MVSKGTVVKELYRVEELSGKAKVVMQGKKGDSLETHHYDLQDRNMTEKIQLSYAVRTHVQQLAVIGCMLFTGGLTRIITHVVNCFFSPVDTLPG